MASGPQASAIPFLGATGADPARPASAANRNSPADGASRGDGGFQKTMAQVTQRQPGPKPAAQGAQKKQDARDQAPDPAATGAGNGLPRDGATLPGDAAAQSDADKSEASGDDQKTDDSVMAAGILLLNPLAPAVATAAAATTVGSAARGALDAVGLGGGNAAHDPQPATADDDADADADTTAVSTKESSASLPLGGGVEGHDKAASPDSDFNAVIKQLDGVANTSAQAGHVADNRDVATREYQSAGGATTTVSVPVGKPGWSDAVVDKVMWMSSQQLSSADIHLNPPDLGPLQVKISTQHDQASVFFTSQHAAVRDALDQALPKLRDMLDSQGIQLMDAGVGGQGAAQQQQQAWRGDGGNNGNSSSRGGGGALLDGIDGGAGGSHVAVRVSTSLVDAYA